MQEFKIALKDGSHLTLKDTQRGRYRLSTLPTNKTTLGAIVNFIWAFQIASNPSNTPEDVAEVLDIDKLDTYIKLVNEMSEGQVIEKKSEAQSSKNGPG